MTLPDECLVELKKTFKANSHVLVLAQTTAAHIGLILIALTSAFSRDCYK